MIIENSFQFQLLYNLRGDNSMIVMCRDADIT